MLTKDNELYTILRNTENEVEIKEVILIVNAFHFGQVCMCFDGNYLIFRKNLQLKIVS